LLRSSNVRTVSDDDDGGDGIADDDNDNDDDALAFVSFPRIFWNMRLDEEFAARTAWRAPPVAQQQPTPQRQRQMQQHRRRLEYADATISALRSWGDDFLYGMLIRSAFDFSPEVLESVGISSGSAAGTGGIRTTTTAQSTAPSKSSPSWGPFTIALHSRHPNADDDGCDASEELSQVESVLSSTSPIDRHDGECEVYLMTDRVCTVQRLREWFEEEPEPERRRRLLGEHHEKQLVKRARGRRLRGIAPTSNNNATKHSAGNATGIFFGGDGNNYWHKCKVRAVTDRHRESHEGIKKATGPSHIREHGPLAGAGFFQDVAYVSQYARHAVVGSSDVGGVRSSTRLVLEFVEYNRVLEALAAVPGGGDDGENGRGAAVRALDPLQTRMMRRDRGDPDADVEFDPSRRGSRCETRAAEDEDD